MQRKFPLRSPLFLLFVLALFLGINTYVWLRLNQRPPVDDEAVHLLSSLRHIRYLSDPSPDALTKLATGGQSLYPPLFPLIASLLGLVFAKDAAIMIMANVLFSAGTFYCLYLIGARMGDKRLGVLASCLLAFYPMFFQLNRMFMLEMTLCFMVTAGITALLFSEGFRKTDASILFGIFFGLGLLTKQTYIVFIAGPLVFLLAGALSAYGGERKRIVYNLFLSLLITAGIASWWYVPVMGRMLPLAYGAAFDSSLVPHAIPVFSLRSFLFYLEVLVNDQVLLFFFVLFIAAVFMLFKRKRDLFFSLFIVWILIPYIIRVFIANKFWYYTFSYLPAVSLVTAYGVLSIKRRFPRTILILAVFIVGLSQFFLISYTQYGDIEFRLSLSQGNKKRLPLLRVTLLPMKDILFKEYYPKRGDWKQKELIARIVRESAGTRPVIGVYCLDPNQEAQEGRTVQSENYAGANFDGLRYYLRSHDIPHKIVNLGTLDGRLQERIQFIISQVRLESIGSGPSKTERQNFNLIEAFVMPDNSTVYLYKLRKADNFTLDYAPSISPSYKRSSARIDIQSGDKKFALEKIASNGVAQTADWLPAADRPKMWISQLELIDNGWHQLWVEFVPAGTGWVFLQLRGSLYLDNKTNRHEVYVDDVAMESGGGVICNGSFEERNPQDSLSGWSMPAASFSQIATLSHSGDYSAVTWHDSPIIQRIAVKAGVRYRISAWFKTYRPS